jgi:hypothetical protein
MKKLKWDQTAKPFLEPVVLGSICSLMIKKYISHLNDETFEMEAQRAEDWIQIRQTLKSFDGSKAYPVEVIIPFELGGAASVEEIRAAELVDLVVDYMDSYWAEYLTDGRDTFLSVDWAPHTIDGQPFFMRGSQHNVALEKMADDFLAKHGMGGYDIAPISIET